MRPTLGRMAHATSLLVDPALSRYANMNVRRPEYFRWTQRTAFISFAYVIAVPFTLGYIAYKVEGKYDLRGKYRGDVIAEF